MGSDQRKCIGLFTMAIRITLAIFALLNSYWYILFAVSIGLFMIGMCMQQGVTAKHGCNVEVNHQKLSDKERKRCCARSFMVTIWFIANGLTIYAATFVGGIYDDTILYLVYASIPVCFILDLYFLKCKNVKYLCASYDEHHDTHYAASHHLQQMHYINPNMQQQQHVY